MSTQYRHAVASRLDGGVRCEVFSESELQDDVFK